MMDFSRFVCAEAIAYGIYTIGIIGPAGHGADTIPAVSAKLQTAERKKHIRFKSISGYDDRAKRNLHF